MRVLAALPDIELGRRLPALGGWGTYFCFCIQRAQDLGRAPHRPLAHVPWSRRPRSTGSSRRRWNLIGTMAGKEGGAGPARPWGWTLWPSRQSASRASRRRGTARHRASHRWRRAPRRRGPRKGEEDAPALPAPRRGQPRRRRRAARRSPPRYWRPRARRSQPRRRLLKAQTRRPPAPPPSGRPRKNLPRSPIRTASPKAVKPRPKGRRSRKRRSGPPTRTSGPCSRRARPGPMPALDPPDERKNGAPQSGPHHREGRLHGPTSSRHFAEDVQRPAWSSACRPRTLVSPRGAAGLIPQAPAAAADTAVPRATSAGPEGGLEELPLLPRPALRPLG